MNPVLVVGAGVAGLAAARELKKRGFEPVVLEARDRCGGRVLSVHDPLCPVPVELGAEFVHGGNAALWDLFRESHATVVAQEGEHIGDRDGDEAGGDPHLVFEAMASAPEQSFAQFIDGFEAPESVKRSAIGYVEGFNAAFKEDISVEWLNREGDDDRSFRVLNGYDSVPMFLARGLDIRYSTAVRRIRWKRGEVVAETNQGEFHASRAIVTVPLAAMCDFDPEPGILPRAKAAIAAGYAIRITLRFREALWENHPRLSFLHGDAPFPVWWTQYPVLAPVITAWAAGPRAAALHGKPKDELVGIALKSLAKILGQDPGEPEASYFHDWQADPWARAAYSYVRVNGLKTQRELAQPLESTLWFAGEAVAAAGDIGTVHGAMASGIKAAQALADRAADVTIP